jgi:hypothetical protein
MDTAPSSNTPSGSVFSRMFNTVAAPGEVFAQIKDRHISHANWLVPALVHMVIASVMVLLLFSQESFMYEIKKQQSKAMDQQVAQGKMTRAQADQFEAASAGWMPVVMKVMAVLSSIMYAFGVPFFWGFIIWLLCDKVFHADVEYMKGVEAAGLALIIQTIAVIISTLVSLSLNKMISLTPALLMGDFDFTNRVHLVLAAINPFYIWYALAVAVSISVMANVSFKRAAAWTLGIWVIHRAILLAIPQTATFTM